jgi:hypothetical protein
MTEARYRPGDIVVCEIGEITCGDGRTVQGAIVEFPAGPPDGMTWADVWDGSAFRMSRAVQAQGAETLSPHDDEDSA